MLCPFGYYRSNAAKFIPLREKNQEKRGQIWKINKLGRLSVNCRVTFFVTARGAFEHECQIMEWFW